jgi:hypothetical protein
MKLDGKRIFDQRLRIRNYMMSHGGWRTLAEIHQETGDPEASISAQLRHLRKPRFGGYVVNRRRRSGGLWEYQLTKGDTK